MKKKNKAIIIGLVILAIIFLMIITYLFNISRDVKINEPIIFKIESGQSLGYIANSLASQKIIRSAFYFKLYSKLIGKQSDFQAGDYEFEGSLDSKKIVELLTGGKSLNQDKAFLIQEGWSIKNITEHLEKEGWMFGKDFSKLAKTKVKDLPAEYEQYDFLKNLPESADLEGYLFPDTYRLYPTAQAKDLIFKMLDNFQNKTKDLEKDLIDSGKTWSQIITMASLLEKEVQSEDDMKIVSGIFWRRLRQGQPLQSCATLAYILGVDKPQYSYEDTRINSPYNTYQHNGLPPGPIANPGIQAIRSALYPTDYGYNYFLSRPDTGETVFSKTYDEHLANKEKYLNQ